MIYWAALVAGRSQLNFAEAKVVQTRNHYGMCIGIQHPFVWLNIWHFDIFYRWHLHACWLLYYYFESVHNNVLMHLCCELWCFCVGVLVFFFFARCLLQIVQLLLSHFSRLSNCCTSVVTFCSTNSWNVTGCCWTWTPISPVRLFVLLPIMKISRCRRADWEVLFIVSAFVYD